jgi:hypothetical protein
MGAIGSLFAGAIVIHADPSTGSVAAHQEAFIRDLAAVLTARGQTAPKIDRELLGAGCSASPACVKEIFSRTRADNVVILEFTRIMGRIRIASDRFKGAAWQKMHAPELELASDSKDWKRSIETQLMPHLFPELEGWQARKPPTTAAGSKVQPRVVDPAPGARPSRDVVRGRADGDLEEESPSRSHREVIKPVDDELPPERPDREL